MSRVRVLVGTRKGAFILTADGKRERWEVSGPHFGGWELYHLKGSPADPNRIYASQCSGWFGQQIQRSDDGGKTWQPVPFTAPGPDVSFTALTASGGGFTAAAQFGSSGGTTAAAVWTSANGTSWTLPQVSGLAGGGSHAITALAASGSAVTGIDSVQTQASQQFVVRSLPSG